MTRTVPGCSRCQGWGRSCCRPCPRPSPPIPCGVTCSLSLGVLEWTGPTQAGRLWFNPAGSLGNWSHPLPLVSAWSAVDYSQRAAAALSLLDQMSAAWWGAALQLMESSKNEFQPLENYDKGGQVHSILHCTVSVLWREEGYTVKYSLSTREIMRAEP